MSILMFHGVKDGGTDVHPFSRGRVVWRDGVNEMLQGTGSSLNVINLCWPSNLVCAKSTSTQTSFGLNSQARTSFTLMEVLSHDGISFS